MNGEILFTVRFWRLLLTSTLRSSGPDTSTPPSTPSSTSSCCRYTSYPHSLTSITFQDAKKCLSKKYGLLLTCLSGLRRSDESLDNDCDLNQI